MTVATARFYSMKGSLSSGEYPLFSANQDLSSFLVSSANVKFAKGLQTRLTVPVFTGYEGVNIIELDGSFYWATEFKESTTVSGSVEYVLDYCAPTSLIRRSQSITGAWNRIPLNTTSYLKNNVTDDVLIVDSYNAEIGERMTITVGSKTKYIYFWHIAGYDHQGNIVRYGGLMTFDKDTLQTDNVTGSDSPMAGGDFGYYPDFEDLFKSTDDCLGILPENVLDFSISQRLPFEITTSIGSQGQILFGFVDENNNYVSPTKNGSNNLYSYDLVAVDLKPISTTETLTITSRQRATGQIGIIDWNGNTVMSIPSQLADSNTVTVTVQTLCDISGIYTLIRCGDIQLSLPEGRLPYNSDTWATYKAYQMDTDRVSMENTIRFAEFNRDTQRQSGIVSSISSGAQSGIMTGIMAGNPAGALAGIPFGALDWMVNDWESQRALELTKMQANANFQLSQKQAQNQPQTAYNTGYGFIYCILNEMRPLMLAVSTPKHLTTAYYSAWIGEYGYPTEGVFSTAITNGYYQGKLLSDTADKTGMYWDECNRVFIQGFKFISP